LTHGENDARQKLKTKIKQETLLPKLYEEIEI